MDTVHTLASRTEHTNTFGAGTKNHDTFIGHQAGTEFGVLA